ncbi:hypothetical protein [Allorhizocola rhizosphaerae]|uniref:hypothetical protein n=1 Tax=Allorhizocola rhizosphaerae TaxID=1872709 RepID=UPI000E3E4B7C|nr:hypothetical protein [Allorhizocola rhizosphaerae]
MSFQPQTIERDLRLFTTHGLLTQHEAAQVQEMVTDNFAFAAAMGNAESIHVHVNAEQIEGLPGEDALRAACRESHGDDRERKFIFDSGLNVIFALDPTAQDEFIPGAVTRQKPYVDHVGIDLRDETDATKAIFDAIPAAAAKAGWRHVAQEGPVRCCHVEMGPKHWVYPPEGPTGNRRPIEFAFGELKQSDVYLGCDYRPIDPAHPLATMATVASTVVQPTKVYVFEECSCNVSPSEGLVAALSSRYPDADVRAFDMAKPEGLLPLPPALFLAIESSGSSALPALVVDGQIRTQGWLPTPGDAPAIVEQPGPALKPDACCATNCC